MAELMMITSIWESIASWFTPTVLFCVFNLIIATIFIASNKHHHHHHLHGDSNSLTQISRVSSFLERTRSINLSSYTLEESQQFPIQPKSANYSSTSRLAQSIHMSSSYVTPPELSESESVGFPVSQLARAPSLFERVKSFRFSPGGNESEFPVESDQISDSPGKLARVPSFLDRVRSFKIASAFNSVPENADTGPGHNPDHHVPRSKSEKPPVKKSLVEMRKSRSEVRIAPDEDENENENENVDMRRPATARESRNDVDEEVDAKADDFISRFKQQLKLQRLESLVRYNEKLNRRS